MKNYSCLRVCFSYLFVIFLIDSVCEECNDCLSKEDLSMPAIGASVSVIIASVIVTILCLNLVFIIPISVFRFVWRCLFCDYMIA